MRIFITGGSGFIGKFVVSLLKDHELLLLTHNKKLPELSGKINLIQGGFEDLKDWGGEVEKFKPEATIHIAWEGIPDYGIDTSLKNLYFGLDLYKLLSKINCKKIITTGSCWEYGGQNGKLSEEVLVKPFNAFTSAKNSLNFLGQEITKEANINFLWTRLFYIYGPGQKEQSLIPYLINCAKNNLTPEIKNPDAENDFVYVEDVADAIYKILLNSNKSSIYNIGSGKLTSVQKIIELIFNKFGKSKKYRKKIPRQTDSFSSFYADIKKIKREIGWSPRTNINEGIIKTIAYSSSK